MDKVQKKLVQGVFKLWESASCRGMMMVNF